MIYISRTLDNDSLKKHKERSLDHFNSYMDSLIYSDNPSMQGKADKLSYWMNDWTNFLEFEPSFTPKSLRRYKRGEIIKVHLGFNVGSEEGGLHYAVVLDKNNSVNSPVVTVVPLTSMKSNHDLNKLHKGSIFIGDELFANLSKKIDALEQLPDVDQKQLNRTKKEISKMKTGSIALVGQIRTISKIRIYDPKTNFDVLSNLKLSSEKLDLIDREIISLYTGQ